MAAGKETPSQTAGPFLHIGMVPRMAGLAVYETEPGAVIAGPGVPGKRIRIEGTVFDGAGAAMTDVMVETWQADASGRFAGADHAQPDFRGFGRAAADFETGLWAIETVKPGPLDGGSAPHIALWLIARGINIGLATRLYFADEADANAADPVLALIQPPNRRDTLIAKRTAEGVYTLDIHLQGDRETVFFDI